MGLYQRLLRTVSHAVWSGRVIGAASADSSPDRHDRLLRTPLLFETMEPRVLLSSDPLSTAAQTALLAGLQSFETWAANQLLQSAQLAQQLPVVSTSVGDLVNLPAQVQSHLVAPLQAYFASTTSPTVEGLAAALSNDPAEAGSVIGQFAHGEFLLTLSNFQTSTSISTALTSAGQRRDQPANRHPADAVRTRHDFGGADVWLRHGKFDRRDPWLFHSTRDDHRGRQPGGDQHQPYREPRRGGRDRDRRLGIPQRDGGGSVEGSDRRRYQPLRYASGTEGTPLASLVSATLSGTGNVTLPVTSSLVPGGSQTLQLNWSGNLSAEGSSNLASLGDWAKLDTISPSLVRQAVAALPGIIQAAANTSGFGANIPVLGQNLSQLFNFGTQFSAAATAISSATTLSQVASALQTALGGGTVTFTVDTANNELDMLITASTGFNTTLPFGINTSVDDVSLVLNGSIQASGTATATLDLGLSFDTSQPDASRLVLVEKNSSLGLSFSAATSTPITAAATLGLLQVQVGGGTVTVAASNGSGGLDTTKPATVTVGFASTGNGRVTLAQVAANPAGSFHRASLQRSDPREPAAQQHGRLLAHAARHRLDTWRCRPILHRGRPARGADRFANQFSVLGPPGPAATAGLRQLGQWAAAMTAATGQAGAFATSLPLLGNSLGQLADLSGVFSAVANAIQSFAAVNGASTATFVNAIEGALAQYNTNKLTLSLDTSQSYAGEIPAANTTEAASLGLTTGTDQLAFNLVLTATVTGSTPISLGGGAADRRTSLLPAASVSPAPSNLA